MEHDEKLDSVQLEYLYLLQSQLASQKIHFEGIIDRLEQQHRQEVTFPQINQQIYREKKLGFFLFIARGDQGEGQVHTEGERETQNEGKKGTELFFNRRLIFYDPKFLICR